MLKGTGQGIRFRFSFIVLYISMTATQWHPHYDMKDYVKYFCSLALITLAIVSLFVAGLAIYCNIIPF